MTKSDAGKLGGTVTLQKYGRDWLRQQGAKGGRPKSPTFGDIRQRQLLEQNNNKEVKGLPGNLRQQKKLFAARYGSSGVIVNSITEAGTAQVTPRERVPAGKEAR